MQVQAKQGTQRLEEGVVIADQGDESEKNASHGASNGLASVWHRRTARCEVGKTGLGSQ